MQKNEKSTQAKTRIVVHYHTDSPPNSLYLRGEGLANISWEKGIALQRVKVDTWLFETDAEFGSAEFKVLIDDKVFEIGDNHPLLQGASMRINPRFPLI